MRPLRSLVPVFLRSASESRALYTKSLCARALFSAVEATGSSVSLSTIEVTAPALNTESSSRRRLPFRGVNCRVEAADCEVAIVFKSATDFSSLTMIRINTGYIPCRKFHYCETSTYKETLAGINVKTKTAISVAKFLAAQASPDGVILSTTAKQIWIK